jgi:hypothetical protein
MDRNGGRINLLNRQVAAGDCSRDGVFGQRRDTSTRSRPNYSKQRIFDLGDLTERVLMNLRPNPEKQNLTLNIECQPGLTMNSYGPQWMILMALAEIDQDDGEPVNAVSKKPHA